MTTRPVEHAHGAHAAAAGHFGVETVGVFPHIFLTP